jgi:xanthine permease
MRNTVSRSAARSTSVFDLNGIPSLGKAIPLGLQHVLAMIVGNVTPAIIVAGIAGLHSADRTLLVQCAMFIAGIATLLQLYPIGKVGSGLPVIMGVSFAYVPTIVAIGAQYGVAGIFGAQLVGGCVAVLVGIFIKHIRKYFPPLVAGTVVFTIGLSLYPIAINYIAGGVGSPAYGSYANWTVAFITLGVVLCCNQFAKGYAKLASILVGIFAGYVISFFLGLVNLTPVTEAAWFAVPRPLHFGIAFYPPAILSMVIMYIVNSVQAVGDLSATTIGGMGREVTDQELSGGIIGNGVASIAASFIGGLPTATYSQNVGIVAMTKVISRFVLAIAAVFILLAGFVPKFGAVMTTIPQSVLGGATITVFAMITMTGIKLIIQDELSGRNMAIVGLAVALGIGITQVPQSLELFPDWVMMVFGRSAVVISTIVAFGLNLILPQKTLEEEQRERLEMEQEG